MDIFREHIHKLEKEINALKKKSDELSFLRLIAFAISSLVIIFLAGKGAVFVVILIPLCVVAFALLIKQHNQVDDLREYKTFLKEINEQELLRSENKLSGFPMGEEYINRDHPYTSDLDIFGKHSVFQLLNRSTTGAGRAALGAWLSQPASDNDILQRQLAVGELTSKLEWRQHLQASGMKFMHTASDFAKLYAWTEKPNLLLANRLSLLVVSILLSIISTIAAVYFFSHLPIVESPQDLVPYTIPLSIVIVINSLILKRVKKSVEGLNENVHQHLKILGGYRKLIQAIESVEFKTEKLRHLLSLINEDRVAVEQITHLEKTLEMLKLKGGRRQFNNMFYGMFNSLWLFDVYLAILAEQWKERNKASLARWANVVGEFEALSSIAGFHYANPTYTFATIEPQHTYQIQFENLGHPLLHSDKRVCNNFVLSGKGSIAMVTGSNMAGKSTFLRTVGINIVLSLMGAPCAASVARVSNLAVFSSMRTQDSLEEGVSSFYAELKRIEQLLSQIESGEPTFFVLDEIFKGTNSKDRHKGGLALIRQLMDLNAFGMISTHDLELATLTEENGALKNYSFNSTLTEGNLEFDYRLTPGLCTDFNASELMKRSGIKIS